MAVKPRGEGARKRYCIVYRDPVLFPEKKLVYLKWVISRRDWDAYAEDPTWFDRQPTIQLWDCKTAEHCSLALRWIISGKGDLPRDHRYFLDMDEVSRTAAAIEVMVAPTAKHLKVGGRWGRWHTWWSIVSGGR